MNGKYRKIALCVMLFCVVGAVVTAQTGDRYFIRLNNKNNTSYSLSNPIQFLTQRSIDRRTNQGIAVDSTDLPVDTAYVRQINATGATVLYTSRWFNAVVARVPDSTTLAAVNALPFVVGHNLVNRYKSDKDMEKLTSPVSSARMADTANVYDYGASQNQIAMLNGICMHNKGYDGRGMQIAILDAGFANADIHPVFDSLRANNQILWTRDFTFNAPLSLYAPSTSGHGTAVLSCMGGYTPGQLVGTAPKAKFWLFRTEFAPSEYIIEEYNWIAGAECADSVGADVINSSLGYNTFDNASENHTMAELDGKTSYASRAATICARKGMIVCSAAGNTGGSGWPKITFPADADSIITVGAVDPNQNHASFSSEGNTADGRVKPDVCAQGVASVVAVGTNAITTSSGTSFASPITAGMVTCLWQANPSKKNMEIVEAVRKSATLYHNPNTQFGYGIPDYCKASDILNGIYDSTIVQPAPEFSLALSSDNPFVNEIKFKVTTKDAFSFGVKIYDVTGKLLFEDSHTTPAGNQTEYVISAANFAAGVYVMKIAGDVNTEERLWQYKLLKVQN